MSFLASMFWLSGSFNSAFKICKLRNLPNWDYRNFLHAAPYMLDVLDLDKTSNRVYSVYLE